MVINNQTIEWLPDSVEGSGIIQTPLSNGLGNGEVNATWKASCVANEAQILSFRVHQVGQDVVKHNCGFTISFKQYAQPEVLRLVGEPVDISNPQDLAGQWTHPNRPHRINLTPVTHNPGKPCLEDEVLQLKVLKGQSEDLQRSIKDQKHKIRQLLRDDWNAFCSTIKECGSLKCIFRVIKQKFLEYAHIISLHCQNRRPSSPSRALSEQYSFKAGNEQDGINLQGPDPVMNGGQEAPSSSPVSPAQHDEIDATPSDYQQHSPSSPTPSQSRSLSPSSTPSSNENERLPISSASRPHNPSYPRFGHNASARYFLYGHILPSIFIFFILSAVTFLTLRHFKLLCASPNRRASRLCAREERRNRRLYRRAARRHAWREWWNRYRCSNSTTDYDEKRTLILEQEDVLEDAMQDEIRVLRTAQEIVAEMARAEEGRARLHQQANMPKSPNLLQYPTNNIAEPHATPSTTSTAFTPAMPQAQTSKYNLQSTHQYRRSSPSASSSHSVDRDSLPPPRYSQELNGDVDVVDGFMYSPTFGAPRLNSHHATLVLGEGSEGEGEGDYEETPDSSVVDCSPRMSFDTGRSTFTNTTGKE